MRVLGVTILAGFALSILFLVSTGCEDEKKEVCCKCTCYLVDGSRPDLAVYTSGTNLNCSSACRTECTDLRFMQSKDPKSIDCATMPAD